VVQLLRRDFWGIGCAFLRWEEGLDGPGWLGKKLLKLVGMDATGRPFVERRLGMFVCS
jgi:hypothetical protein